MIDAVVKFNLAKLMAATKKARRAYLSRAGGLVRRIAKNMIGRRTRKPSKPGEPPASPTGQLRNSILFAVEEQRGDVIIGPAKSLIAEIGNTHEFGKRIRGRDYPERPFMGPALEAAEPQLSKIWEDSITK